MGSSRRPVTAFLTLAALVLGGVSVLGIAVESAGCTPGGPAEGDLEVDPTLPTVDASTNARPVEGSTDASMDATSAPDSKIAVDAGVDAGGETEPSTDAGADVQPPGIPRPAQGELLITEVMYATFSPEPASEWFEVYNAASSARALSGLTLKDGGGRTHVIGAGVTLGPKAYGLIVRDRAAVVADKVPSSSILYEYGGGLPDNAGVLLANGASGGLAIFNASEQLANVPYGGWFSQSGGSSLQLKKLDYAAGALQASWCLSATPWTTGSNKGTPGVSADCP